MTLRVRGLRSTYPGWPETLKGVDLEVAPGHNAFVLGPSGSGKSTLLRCIAGLARPDAGTVHWNDEELTAVPAHARRIGFLFQEPALFAHLNVWRNVAFGLRYRGVARRQERAEAERYLDLVGLLPKATARVHQLSGGQRSRVALARTLAAQPRAVLLDEPFGTLDEPLRRELGDRIKDLLREQGVAAVWVTHDRDEALRLGEQVWELRNGVLEPFVLP